MGTLGFLFTLPIWIVTIVLWGITVAISLIWCLAVIVWWIIRHIVWPLLVIVTAVIWLPTRAWYRRSQRKAVSPPKPLPPPQFGATRG